MEITSVGGTGVRSVLDLILRSIRCRCVLVIYHYKLCVMLEAGVSVDR